MQRYSNWRIKTVTAVVLLLTCILIVSAYRLQIIYNEKYTLISDKNRVRITPVLPRRGRIITADGKVIARSINRYKLVVARCSENNFSKIMQFVEQNIELDPSDLKQIAEQRKNHNAFVTIKDDLSWDEYAKISINLFKFNNLAIEHSYMREYIDPEIFSHITGYTSKNINGFQMLIGKTGVESYFNDLLTGNIGSKQTEVNAAGKTMRTLETIPAQDGQDLHITIDADLQQFVYNVMSEQKAGGCVVLDMSGNVLAMVSIPGFDTNLLSKRMTSQQWAELRDNPLFPMLNRVTNCAYPPGSVFKIVVAAATLDEKITSPQDKIYCSGGMKLDNHIFHCWNRGGHGFLNLSRALQYSCDCYFFDVSKKLGIDHIVKYAKRFGYGEKTGIEISGETAGLLPTREWKFLRYKTHWMPYETVIAGIGQGSVLTTVIQAATMMGRLYTNNDKFSPTLVGRKERSRGESVMNKENANVIKQALALVCTIGTASKSCKTKYGIAGKTGSSQVRKLRRNEVGVHQSNFEWKYRDHAFFAGVAPVTDPQYIIVVFVEHGGGGSSVAAPIARKIFDKIMRNRKAE